MNKSKFLLEKLNIFETTGLINSFSKKSGQPVKEVERLWKKSKQIIKKQYPEIKKEDDKFFSLVVGVLKKILKIK